MILLFLYLSFMNFGIYPELTKKYILDRLNQIDIMNMYLKVYGSSVVFDELVKSPFRKDNNPTCGFKYNSNGKLRMRDFGGHFWGDCFDVCARVIGVNSSTKTGFRFVLETIAKDFKIHKYEHEGEIKKYYNTTKDFFEKKHKIKTRFHIVYREYSNSDFRYWNQFNVNYNLLKFGKVFAAQEIYISKNNNPYSLLYLYRPTDPAYCYYGGQTNNINNWKIYYPLRDKTDIRFHSNSSFLQGKHLITCGRVGIITKSYKDVLSMRSFGLQAVAPSAESVLLNLDDYWFMKTKFDFLISCMDYDRAGMRMAQMLRKTYGIPAFMFTNGNYNSYNYNNSKDFAEYVNNCGTTNTNELLKNLYTNHEYAFDKLDKYYYKSLKFI